MDTVKFTEMKHGSKDDYLLLDKYEQEYINGTANRIIRFLSGLNSTLEGYKITRLEHSLQTATRALNDKASEEIRVALQLNPESVELRRTLAVLLEKQGRAQDAMDAWRTAVRLDENDAASLFGFAKALKAGGNDTEAAQHLERVVNLA